MSRYGNSICPCRALIRCTKNYAAVLYDMVEARRPTSVARSDFLAAAQDIVKFDEFHANNFILATDLERFDRAGLALDPHGLEGISINGLAEMIAAIEAKHRARLS